MRLLKMESSHDAAYIDHYAIFSPCLRKCNTTLAYPIVFPFFKICKTYIPSYCEMLVFTLKTNVEVLHPKL